MKKKITLIQMNLEKLAEDQMKKILAGDMCDMCHCLNICHCKCYCKAEQGQIRRDGSNYPSIYSFNSDDNDMWNNIGYMLMTEPA